jgi:hypothetical protein
MAATLGGAGHHGNGLFATGSAQIPGGVGSWSEVMAMQATVGQRLHIHGRNVGSGDDLAEILEVRGEGGQPPYLVRYPDGHESVIFPGPDCEVEDQES